MNMLVRGDVGYYRQPRVQGATSKRLLPITYDNLSRGNRWAVKRGPFEKSDIAGLRQVRTVLE
jgi:UDP-glucose 4-epimerase